jgi:hypothetical protein
MGPDETKAALKEALKEWLDSKFAAFGKWSLTTIAACALAVLTYFILQINGWHR